MKNGNNNGLALTWEDNSGYSYTSYYSNASIGAAMSQFLNLQSLGLKVKLATR